MHSSRVLISAAWSALLLPAALAGCAQDDRNRVAAEQWVDQRSHETEPTSRPHDDGPLDSGGPAAKPENAHVVHSDGLLVNDQVVTVNDILEPIQPQIDDLVETLSGDLYYRRVLELVRQEIVDSVAHYLIYRRASDNITEDMEPNIKKAVEQMERERISREFHGLETEYENYLQTKKKTRDDVRARLRRSIVVDSYLRDRLLSMIPAPRKSELLKYYHEHISDFRTPASRELYLIDIPAAAFFDREILLRSRPPLAEEERAVERKARDEAEAAVAELQAGDTFEEVAKRHSHGPHKEDGGFWGPIQSPMAGRWKAPYDRFIQMKEGETSGIIEASRAFFIVKVGRVQEEHTKTFEESQPDIIRAMKNERFHQVKADFLQEELRKSTISSLDQFVMQVMSAVPKPKQDEATDRGVGR